MSYGQQPRGYGQSDLQIGMPVSSDNGWTGTVTEIIPAAPGYEGAVRVAWHGDGTTLVALAMFAVEQGQAVIRTQPPPPPPPPPVLQPQPAPQRPVVEDEMSTRLTSPVQNDPSHVNPFVSDPPLVTTEPPPLHPTHGGQMHDDMTYLPSAPQPDAAASHDLEATYIPPRDAPAPQIGGAQTFGDEQATYIPPRDAPAPAFGAQQTYGDAQATYIPPRDMPAPELSAYPSYGGDQAAIVPPVPHEMPPHMEVTTPLDRANAPRPDALVIEPQEREVTVPVMEEQVEARPEWRDAGSITVRTVTEEIPQTLTGATQREELFVERVAVGRELLADEVVMPRDEGETHVIPIVVEEAVLVTRRILVEELRITKRMIPTTQTIETVIRKERVEIDAGDLADRVHDASGTDAATDGPQAPGMPNPFSRETSGH